MKCCRGDDAGGRSGVDGGGVDAGGRSGVHGGGFDGVVWCG